MPALHGPLPSLEQEAPLPLRLLHAGRNPPEPFHNFPVILQGDTGATKHVTDSECLWWVYKFPYHRRYHSYDTLWLQLLLN